MYNYLKHASVIKFNDEQYIQVENIRENGDKIICTLRPYTVEEWNETTFMVKKWNMYMYYGITEMR